MFYLEKEITATAELTTNIERIKSPVVRGSSYKALKNWSCLCCESNEKINCNGYQYT